MDKSQEYDKGGISNPFIIIIIIISDWHDLKLCK